MAKLADAADLKSADQQWLWGFKSPSRHQHLIPRSFDFAQDFGCRLPLRSRLQIAST